MTTYAVWLQKWFVHRRLRPEQLGGRLQLLFDRGVGGTDLNHYVHDDLLNSAALGEIQGLFGNSLLPQAFPEGSPMHPSYGAGHATVAGACTTLLKAWFDENHEIPDPVIPNDDGTELIRDPNPEHLTVGGELNKLASNIAIGRNGGGVHWRTDYTKSVVLGEAVTISILQEQSLVYSEDAAFTLTTFAGRKIKIGRGTVTAL